MLGGLIGTAIGTVGGNFLEKGIGSIFGKSTADQNYEYERRLQQHDQEFQKEMRATAYQTAVKDMQKAGINPAVALSNGGGDTYGGSSSHGSVAMQTPTSGTMAETMSSIINTALTKAQKENIEADTELKGTQAGKTKTEIKAIEIDNEIKQLTAPIDIMLKQAQTKQQKAQAEKAKAEIVKYEKEMAEMDARIEQLKADGKLKQAQEETERRIQKGIQTREWIKTIAGAFGTAANVASAF